MADPKLPKQLSEESPLVEFAVTGNLYADPSYSSEETTPAVSPITQEALVFGENTITNFTSNSNNSPNYNLAVPSDGSAYFVSNLDRGTARGGGHDYFFNYKRGNGLALADIYIINSKGGDFSASPRAAKQYVADSDGTLNVYIEGSTFGGNLMGFGSQTDVTQTFTGNYEFTFKNSVTQWFCITYGTGFGLGERGNGNNRFGTVIGNIDLLLDGSTITNNGAVIRGGLLPGEGEEKAYLRAYFKDTLHQGEFGIIMTGSDNNNNDASDDVSFKSFADFDITVSGSTYTNAFVMFPNASNSGLANSGENSVNGNVSFKMTGSTVNNGLVLGAGRRGANNDGRAQFNGNIDFEIGNSIVTGELIFNKGTMNTQEKPGKVTGKIVDSSVENVLGFWTGGTGNFNYADVDLTVSNSTINNFDVGHVYDDKIIGVVNVDFAGSTAARIWSDRRYNDNNHDSATYNLVFSASEKTTKVTGGDGIRAWNNITVEAGANVEGTIIDSARKYNSDTTTLTTTLTVEAGASLRLSGAVSHITSVTLNGADLLSAGSVSDITTLSVVDASLTKGDIVLISGLTEFDEGDIETVTINGAVFSYGVFGGQYELVGSDLVAHLDATYMVNNNYTGNNVDTGIEGVKGYKDLGAAQTAAKANGASLIFTTMDYEYGSPDFTADVSTLEINTKFIGDDGTALDLNSINIIIGDASSDVASAEATIAYANNINSISFGNVTGTAKASISNVGRDGQIESLDLTGAVIGNADIAVSDSVIGDLKLADNEATAGKITVSNSTIATVYGGAAELTADLTGGNTITNVYAEGNGAKMKFGTSTVETYIAGSATEGKEINTLVYDDSVSAQTLIIGGNANQIGKIDANVTGGVVEKLIVGNDGDTVSGDIDLTLSGGAFATVSIAENASLASTSNVNVELAGGTVAPVNGTFYGLVYGASVTGALDGGSQGASRTLVVSGNARVGSIRNFDSIEVKGGTLNVESGDRKDDPTAENSIVISGDITNRRAIQAGFIQADSLINHGMVGVLRNSAEDPGIQLSGDFYSDTFVRTSVLSVDGSFTNSGEVTSVGDITVDGAFSNSGQIYIRSSFDKEYSEFTQDGGIALKNADLVNTGDAAFISTGFLKGVKNLSTNRLYVTGGAEITGSITIEAGAEVAFTTKALKKGTERYEEFKDSGLKLSGNLSMYDTSSLIISGNVPSGKTLTVNTEGDGLVGSNVLVKAEGGLDSWTIKWGDGLTASSYGLVRNATEILIYSVDELYVNSSFASYQDGDEIKINGKTFIYGLNAFASVEDATYFAGMKGYNSSVIAVINDKSGMDVDTTYGDKVFDLALYNSTVGAVTAKSIFVGSDSSVKSIDAATLLTIDADATLAVTDTIVDNLDVVIYAMDGSGSRKVLAVDPEKVKFADGQVTVLAPLGNESYAVAFSENGDTVYLKADANIFLFASDATITDGSIDRATGDVLFAGVNAFTDEAAAAAAANASGGTLWIADGSNQIRAIAGVSKVALEYAGNSDVYGSDGESFVSDQDYSVKLAGVTSSAKIYGLNKSVDMSGDYTFELRDSNLTANTSAIYIMGNNVNNVMNGNINAVIENVRTVGRQDVPWGNGGWNEGIYLGYGSFGTDPNAPIDVNVTLRGVTSSNSGFYGIQTQPSDGPTNGSDISTSSTPADQQVRQDINANINIKVFDSVIGGTFTVLNTNNDHWNADGASLLNTYFSSGSITVEVGNSDFGTNGNWRNIRLGASLQLGGKAIQEFNVPNTLHIVATENGTTTRAAYVNEWDTIIVDATAQLWLNDEIQYSTVFGPNEPLDDAGTLSQIMINMSGYKSGTHNVITAGGQIRTDATLSNITVIGDNDLTGQCQLAYAFSADKTQLKGVYIFDKADDMYVNASYTDAISGTKVAGQELLFNYNAFTSFDQPLQYADEWGGTIIVTGGEFGSQDFHGNNVEVRAATISYLSMANEAQSRDEVTLTVKDGAVIGTVDGSNNETSKSTLNIAGEAQIGDIVDFDSVTLNKGVALEVGDVSGAGFEMFADNELKAKSVSFNGTEKIVLDVTGYTAKGHAIISTENGISGFDPNMVEFVAHDKGKTKTDLNNYSVKIVGNDLVLRNALKSDTYLNSNYTAASMPDGITLPDGSYLEYGFNAFDDPTAAAANLGKGSKFTLTVTGGEISGDIKLGGNNFVMDEGTVDGVVYACVNTEDKGGFYSGKTYTVTSGTIGGFDLTAGEGVYNATNSAINLGKDVTITGNIIGGGDTVVTSEGKFSVGGLIKGVGEIVLRADGFLSAGGIDLGSGEGESVTSGTLRVIDVPFGEGEVNRRLLVQSETDIKNVQFAAGAGTTLYSTGKEIYLLDLSRIYFDSNFTADVDGTILPNGDVLRWNVNAFSGLANSVAAARASNGTLIIQNANREANISGLPPVNVQIVDSNITRLSHGVTRDQTFNGDVSVVVKNSTIGNNNSYIMGVNDGTWDHRNTLNGKLYVDVSDSTISNNLKIGSFFNAGNKTYDLNFTNTAILGDLAILRDSPFASTDTVTVNMTGVTTSPTNKWWTFFEGYPRNLEGTVNFNLKDSVLGTGNGFRIALQRSCNDWNGFNANFQFNVSVENSTVNGNILAERIEGTDIHFDGVATLNVTGENRVNEVQKFNVVNMAAGATITGYAITVRGTGLINVDAGNYDGPTKNIIWMNNRVEGSLGDIKNLKDGYLVVKGSRAVLISDGNVTNLYVDANYGSSVTGTTSSAGDILIFENDASDAGDVEHANALTNLEDAKEKLTAGNRLFVAASENVLYGTREDEEVTSFVDLVVTNGDFSTEGSKIAVADVDEGKSVSGDAKIELAGGSIGKAATIDPETGEEIEPAVYATIDGTRSNVTGKSEFVLSKGGGIYADVKDFDTMTVTSEARVHGTITVDALAIEGAGFLTVDGTLDTDSIHIATSTYDGASKRVLVADELATIDKAKITTDEGGEFFLDRENKTLWLVSTAPGNVYFNTGYTDAINGTTFNNDLLFLNTNAFTSISRDNIALRSTSDNTVYVLDGNFGAEVVDLAGIGTRKLEFQGGSVGGFKVDAGSTVSVTGTTSAVNIGSLSGVPTGEGEEVKAGIGVTLKPENATNITSIDGVNYFRFNAANAANITVGQVDFLENGGQFIVDFAGYTSGAAAKTTLLTAANGVNNFLQYIQPEEGDKYSTTVMETRNNDSERLMVYYDEDAKAVYAVKRGNAAFLEGSANNSVNGTVEVVDGVENTKVYGFNVSTSLGTASSGLYDGDFLVIRDVDRSGLNSNVTPYVNIIASGSTFGAARFGAEASNDNDFVRTGDGTMMTFDKVTFTDAHDVYLLGRGNSTSNRLNLVAGTIDGEGNVVNGTYSIKFTDGGYTNTGGNGHFRAVQNAKIGGGVMDVSFENFTMNGDLQLFDDVYAHNSGQLEELRVTMTNITSPGAKYMWVWDPRDNNTTKISVTITDSEFRGGTDTTFGFFGDNTTTNWTGEATLTISGVTSSGTLSGSRGLGQYGGDVDSVTEGNRVLVVGGTDSVNLVKMFNEVDIADDAFLTGGTISLVQGNNAGFVILGESGKDYGKFKSFVNVTGSINNATGVKFVDKTDKETVIEGYTAVLGSTNVFIYTPGSLGDVFYSTSYSAANNGTAVKNADGSDTVLVFGDNAVKTMDDAYTALKSVPEGTVLQIQGAADKDLYTAGYTTIVNGGSITGTLFGGAAPDTTDPENPVAATPVEVVNITLNKTATVANLTVATELSQVTGDALVTIADGVSVNGAIDGGSGFVGGVSALVFNGAATAGSIVGFDTVKLNANEVVSLTGAFTGEAITIDAAGFADFSKKVLTATDITVPATGITVINAGEQDYGWAIVNDGEGKALIITSDLVKDTYANAAWTPETELGFVGDTALVWDKNAFNSVAAAASKVGEGNVLYVEGGAFSAEEAITLEKNNDVVVSDDATFGALTTGGKLTVNKSLTATSISGVSALNLSATGKNSITVDGAVALAAEGKLTIDISADYTQEVSDVVIFATGEQEGLEGGIFVGETELADHAAITLTGSGTNSYYAYYDADSKDIHMLRLDTFYLDSGWWDNPDAVPEYHPITGEPLFYGKNASGSMNTIGSLLLDGKKLWVTNRNGSIHTGGPAETAPNGDGTFLSEVHVLNSNVDQIVIGGTTGERIYVGDTVVSIANSLIATNNDLESWLVSNVTADNPWSHRNTLFGNVTVDVTNSTIGTAANPSGANAVRILNFTNVVNRSETEKSVVNVNFSTSSIYRAIRFLGDSPMGKDVVREAFSTTPDIDDGGIGTFEELNINLDTVTVGGDVRWAIRGGGARDQVTSGVVTVNMKDTTFGSQAVFAIEDDWSEGDINANMPKNGSDFVFNLENTTINGYLVAGRRSYDSTLADLSVDADGNGYSGARVLNVIGSNYVKNALFFKEINLTGDSSLQGDTVRLFTGNDLNGHVDSKINVDLTGYEGGSKYLINLNFTYDDDGNITGGGIEGFDAEKTLVVTGLVEPAEGEEPAYKLVTDLDADGHVSKVVVKATAIKDIFVNSTFVEDDFDPLLGKASKTGDAMYYGENAFSTMVGYEDEETGETIPGALPALQANPNAVLRVTGGVIETETLLSNSITIDAGATLAYQGSTTITVDGVVENNGNFVIDASEFIKGAPDRVTILVADEILGKDISVTTKTYSVEKALNETTSKWELTLVRKAEDVYVSTAWADLTDGTEVTIGDVTAYIGFTAFANANTALSKVNSNGSVTVIDSDVAFTNAIARGVTVYVDATSKVSNTTVGSDTTGVLVLQSGAIGSALSVAAGSTLTVEAGATVTGGLGMNATAKVAFAEGSTLDFNIVGQSALEGARVTNLSAIGESAPTFTVTIDAGIKDGAYKLATGAAGFGSAITLKTETADIQTIAFGERVLVESLGAYFQTGIDDNNVLILTKEASQDVIYVNSTWTEGQVVVIDSATVTVGENGFTTGDAAYAKAVSSGATSIKVVGGVASFADGIVINTIVQNAELTNTNVTGTLTVSETGSVTGKAVFAPAEGKTITIDGTVAFDTALTTEGAQFTGLSYVGGATKYTLTVSGEVASGDAFLLASGAEGFASTVSLVGSDVVLTVGEAQIVNGLSYKLTLVEGNLSLEISDKPVPAVVYVNSTWTVADGEPVTISDTVTATMGYDAFKNGNAAYAAVAADGSIVVLGGEVSFTSAVAKTLTVNADAKLTGKAAFATETSITIDGTIVFDTQYAATAQITGLANVAGATKYELVDSALTAGAYVLADGLTSFDSTIAFGENTLVVGGEAIEVGDFKYSLEFTEGSLTLSVVKDEPQPVKPETVYVNSAWTTEGAVVEISEGITATVGVDAFADYATAAAKVAEDGTIVVNGGNINFSDMTQKTVVDADVTILGKAAFTAETAITVNGTFMFDTAIATATVAQITGFQYIQGSAKYALTDVVYAEDEKTYRLASDVVSFNGTITVSGEALTLDQGVRVNGYDYALALSEGNLTLTVTKFVPETKFDNVYVNSAYTVEGEVVEVAAGVFATVGTDAFATYGQGVPFVNENGTITVTGNEISFPNGVGTGFTTVVGESATLAGVSAFTSAITVNGTVAFDTAYATATTAQISGLSFVTGNASYTLTASAVAGTYLLATDAATFSSAVAFGENTLVVGGEAIEIDGFKYALGITDNNELALIVSKDEPGPQPTIPTKAYMNSEWAGLPAGEVIAGVTIGYDGFATLAEAEAAETTENTVEVVGGEVNFANGYTKAITVDAGAKIVGTAAFDKAITVNGTFVFDITIATAAAAQFTGSSFVTGNATYELVAELPAIGTYLLTDAQNVATVAFGAGSLTVGAKAVVIGNYTYKVSYTDNNVLALEIGEKPVPPTPTQSTVYVDSAFSNMTTGTVVTVPGGQATVGVDAFGTADEAVQHLAEDGDIKIIGGEASFSGEISAPVTVDAGATLTGKVAIVDGGAVLIDGTLAFDTAYAADGEQVTGFENVILGENAQFTLTTGEAVAGQSVKFTKSEYEEKPLYTDMALFGQQVTVDGDENYVIGSNYFAVIDGVSYVLDLDKKGELVLNYVQKITGTEATGFDDNGKNNTLIVSKQPNQDVTGENAPFTSANLQFTDVYVDRKGEILEERNNKTYYNHVSKADAADYVQIVLDKAMRLSLSVDATEKVKITLYSVSVSSKGKWSKKSKASKSLSKNFGTPVSTKSVLIQGGTYYVAVENANKKNIAGAFYNVSINEGGSRMFVDGDDNTNDYLYTKSAGLNPRAKALEFQDNAFSAAEVVSENVFVDDEGAIYKQAPAAPAGKSDWTNFVGFGDTTDFAKISPEAPAALKFTIDATASVEITVYKLTMSSSGKWTQTKLKSKKVTVKSSQAYNTGTTAVVLLDRLAGTSEVDAATGYYVSVKSTTASKGAEAYYNVTATGKLFLDADESVKGVSGNGWLLNGKTSINTAENLNLEANTGLKNGDALALDHETYESGDNFVGFGDEYDYAAFTVEQGGKYTFTFNVSGKAKFSVYKVTQSSSGKYTSKSLATKSTKGAAINQITKQVTLEAGVTYYVSMQALDVKKGEGASVYYDVTANLVQASNSSALDDALLASQSVDSFADASAFIADSQMIDDKQSALQSVSGLIA